ncbi:GNAT family N-acetyltransferase [Peristeroidobacter agariperforans]|uniref:GNAT family N-acetyltransferase n=1 Tax=Peristeroidobacter agariperforans TaxID=268404 RepID=UPI00101BD9B0|nr:GNAT family N-acetyltransferase [Peristeroidobacter agariperforans]
MRVLETERLVLRRLTLDDAEFIFRLVNEPSWLRYIGDKHVRNLDDARNYLRTGPLDMYDRFGFGMFLCELKSTGEAVGSCGLLKRDTLPDPDIGYAFLPEHWGKGYALEAASAVLKYGHREHRLPRILAITSPDNERSIQVLQKCGMHFQRFIEMAEQDQVKLFALEFVG